MKQLRNEKNGASGSGNNNYKRPYAYSQHLEFLKTIEETAATTSLEIDDNNESSMSSIVAKKASAQRVKRCKNSKFKDGILKKFDAHEEESTHISFMKGIEPSLQTLTADEVLEWQHSAIEALISIKKRKRLQNPVHSSGQQS